MIRNRWSLLLLILFTAIVIFSFWKSIVVFIRDESQWMSFYQISLINGSIIVYKSGEPVALHGKWKLMIFQSEANGFSMVPSYSRAGGPLTAAIPNAANAIFPLWWIVPILLFVNYRVAIRARRAAKTCDSCGYLLEGLPSGSNCPECGRRD